MKLKIMDEELLTEATWKNAWSLEDHFKMHVLKEGEVFDPQNPKFAFNMTLEDYKNEAEKLSEAKADKSVYAVYKQDLKGNKYKNPLRSPNTVSNIIGWELEPQEKRAGRSPRKIKVSKTIPVKFFPEDAKGKGKFRAAVIYVDEPSDDNIITYYIIREEKFINLFRHQWSNELPENQEKLVEEPLEDSEN